MWTLLGVIACKAAEQGRATAAAAHFARSWTLCNLDSATRGRSRGGAAESVAAVMRRARAARDSDKNVNEYLATITAGLASTNFSLQPCEKRKSLFRWKVRGLTCFSQSGHFSTHMARACVRTTKLSERGGEEVRNEPENGRSSRLLTRKSTCLSTSFPTEPEIHVMVPELRVQSSKHANGMNSTTCTSL